MTLRKIGLLAILISTIVATILATSINMEGYEMGALFNVFLPAFIGIIAIIVFLITDWLSKSKQLKISVLILLCGYLLYMGLVFNLQKGYLPFPFN